jgi:hypothetical protein
MAVHAAVGVEPTSGHCRGLLGMMKLIRRSELVGYAGERRL